MFHLLPLPFGLKNYYKPRFSIFSIRYNGNFEILPNPLLSSPFDLKKIIRFSISFSVDNIAEILSFSITHKHALT